MKKDVTVTYHFDNMVEIPDFVNTELDDRLYYLYPTFCFDNDIAKPYLILRLCKESNCFTTDCITMFPPECESEIDLYIQFSFILQVFKDYKITCCIQKLEYQES